MNAHICDDKQKCTHEEKIKKIEEEFGEKVNYCPFCGLYLGDFSEFQNFDDIFNSFNGLQKNFVYELVGRALKDTGKTAKNDDNAERVSD